MARIGVYICHCGLNIAGVIDAKDVAEYAAQLPNVTVTRDNTYLCSNAGQKAIQDDIQKHQLDRIVVASCSPRMHEETFRNALREVGLNPYLLEMINIREQSAWVHSATPDRATEKTKTLVAMAVARAAKLEPLTRSTVKAEKKVLVIGGGIAGIQASLDLANSGFSVCLVEKSASIGGRMAQLDKTFPTLDCSACILTPKMAEVGRHPNIELLTRSEVEQVSGFVGNYEVTVRTKPRYIDEANCTGCGECEKVCPVTMPSEFDLGLTTRKAVYRPFPQAVPNVFTIDKKGTAPCRVACPAGVNVQGYLALAKEGKFEEAYNLIRKFIPFPSVCGRVCFHPCESECERGKLDEPVAINAIKRFLSDYVSQRKKEPPEPAPKRYRETVAIVGGGPAGLTAAYELVTLGYPVTLFEAASSLGGMLRVGIPNYRLPPQVLDEEVAQIKSAGVDIRTNFTVGTDATLTELLQQGYDAIFLAVGVQRCRKLGIEGETLTGVIPALEFLKCASLGTPTELGRRVAIIGGGNVAIDAARTALRQGAEAVQVLYRRSRAEMPAYSSEIEQAETEGVHLHFLAAPIQVLGKEGRVVGLECVKIELGKPDKSGRRRPIPIKGSTFVIDVDTVIPAIGQSLDVSLLPANLRLTSHETVAVDSTTLETNLPGVFAGGDAAKGEATVIDAIADAKRAVASIHRYLRGEDMHAGRDRAPPLVGTVSVDGIERHPRQEMPRLALDERTGDREVELGFTEDMAKEEATRCLACGGCAECLECERACELSDVIDHKQDEEHCTFKVGGIIVAVGSALFDVTLTPELGSTRSGNVISNLQFERLSNAAGPTHGKILLPDGDTAPTSVAFIQCVGSRDQRFCEYCCRIGCMVTLKQAILTKEKMTDSVEVYVCYNDMRAFGKGYEEFYERARRMGIKFVRGLPSEIRPSHTGGLRFDVYESTTNKLLEIQADLVVLAAGLVPTPRLKELTDILRIPRSADGFLLETHPKLRPLETSSRGIFLAGACQGPKDIPDAVAQASGAAMKAIELLATGEVEIEPLIAVVEPDLCGDCRICEAICPYQAIETKEEGAEGAEKKVAHVLSAVCQGCGACAAACPTHAIDMQHFKREQILAQIRAATQGGEKT